MNFIAAIILIALLADFILHRLADIFNLHVLADTLPAEFEGVYEPQRYQKSQTYLRVNTRFGWIGSGFGLLTILVFWFAKGFAFLDGWVRAMAYGPVSSGLIFIGILLLAKGVLSLPFSLYDTFVIEERFGFNKTTLKTFVLDIIKGLALSIILGAPLLAGILAFFEYAGAYAWFYCWLATTAFMLVVQYVAPTWIMPLFNKFEPLEEGSLREAIMDYARSIAYPLQNIFVMDGSKRSGKSNAFFTGFGKRKRIVLFDTLIKQHTDDELLAVLAHEMGHYKKKHIQAMMAAGVAQTGLMFFLLSLFISHTGLFAAFYVNEPSVYAGLLFFGMLYLPAAFFLGIVLQIISRKNEYTADRFAVKTTGKGDAMISALKNLTVSNLANLSPHPFYVFLNYSHPPVLARIKAIRNVSQDNL